MNRRVFLASLGVGLAAVTFGGTLPATDAPAAVLDAPWTIGDVFTMAGYTAKNPVTGADTGVLQYFFVTDVFEDRVTCIPCVADFDPTLMMPVPWAHEMLAELNP